MQTTKTICTKYHILFSEKIKKNIINLSFAELAQRVVKVIERMFLLMFFVNKKIIQFLTHSTFTVWIQECNNITLSNRVT